MVASLDIVGHLASLRNSLIQESFRPLHLRYLSFNPLDNSFKLLLDKGSLKEPAAQEIQNTSKTLMQYFLVGLTLPNDIFWVNLRPDSPDQIIDDKLAQTDIGKIMLETDLQLKKDTALFTSPNTPEGKEYWDKLYKKAGEIYGNENITIPTLTRPWIVPGEIIVRETAAGVQAYKGAGAQVEPSAYIYKATLKVMLEQDRLMNTPNALNSSMDYSFKDVRSKALNEYSSQLIRELLIPKLTKEINSSKRYAAIRQVYYSLILAQWFKARQLSAVNSQLPANSNQIAGLINSNRLTNLTSKTTWSKITYFNAYKKSFAEGEYNIQEPHYTPTGQAIRSYVSGGMAMAVSPGQITVIPGIVVKSAIFASSSLIPVDYSLSDFSPHEDTVSPDRQASEDNRLRSATGKNLITLLRSGETTTQAYPFPAGEAVTPENASSAAETDLLRQDSLRSYLIRNRGDVVRIDLLPDAILENTQYYSDYIYQRIGNLLFVFYIDTGKIFIRDWKKGGVIEPDLLNKFISGLENKFIEKIAEAVRKKQIYEPFRVKLLRSQKIIKLLGFSPQEASILLQDTTTESVAQTELIIKNLELGNVLELRFDNLTLEEALQRILDMRFRFSEISRKYGFYEFEDTMRELQKNAFVHGNRMDLKLPIFIHFDKGTKQIEVYDLAIERKLPGNIPAGWAGLGKGISTLSNHWEYDKARIIDEKSGQAMTRATIRQRGNADSPVTNTGKIDGSAGSPVGGIDFRSLPIVTQAMANLSANLRGPSTAPGSGSSLQRESLKGVNLDEEWERIKRMVSSGIKPSTERIKEYAQASSALNKISQDRNKIIVCISDILRQEEECCEETDPVLKDILVVLESIQRPQELKEVFLGKVI